MNIEVYGRLRAAVADDRRSGGGIDGSSLELDGNQKLINKLIGNSFK
jgi:hypothetical protein